LYRSSHLIDKDCNVRDALIRLNVLASNAIVFITDERGVLLGSLTDGDIRRGLIRGLNFETPLLEFAECSPQYILQGNHELDLIIKLRNEKIFIIPVLDQNKRIVNIINLRNQHSYLPIDALIMAGGRGERLRPLTDTIPKPLLPIGGKPIIEHNVDRIKDFGIDNIWISLGYKGEQIEQYFRNGEHKSLRISYINERTPLGTAGALSLVETWSHQTILLMNSDLLTDVNYEDLYLYFINTEADLAVVSIPYEINVPYAILELSDNRVLSLKEKPTYTHYANAGIYLMKREVISLIPRNEPFNATDLIEKVILKNGRVVSYTFLGYWLDIGRHEDYKRAQDYKKHTSL